LGQTRSDLPHVLQSSTDKVCDLARLLAVVHPIDGRKLPGAMKVLTHE
jgi:hypothetical protein